MIVYRIDFDDGSFYIGRTVKSLDDRIANHKVDGVKLAPFLKSMKYDVKVLYEGSAKDAMIKENELIDQTRSDPKGLNTKCWGTYIRERHHKNVLTLERTLKLQNMFNNGYTTKEMALDMDVSRHTIRRWLENMCEPSSRERIKHIMRVRGTKAMAMSKTKVTNDMAQKMRQLSLDGYSDREIGKKMDVSESTVYRWLRSEKEV